MPQSPVVSGVRETRVRGAFTLVELLVVVGIIAMLISILLPALSAARRQADTVKCLSNLRQMGQGFAFYVNDWGVYPWPSNQLPHDLATLNYTYQWSDQISYYLKTLGCRMDSNPIGSGSGGTTYYYQGGKYKFLWTVPLNQQADTIFRCPSDPIDDRTPYTSYSYNWNLAYGVRVTAAKLKDTTNIAVIGCGGGYCHGARRVFYYGNGSGSRFDALSAWHSTTRNLTGAGASTMLFADGHASRIDVDIHKVEFDSNSPTTPCYFIDPSIRIQPDRVYTLPRTYYP